MSKETVESLRLNLIPGVFELVSGIRVLVRRWA